MDLSLPEHAPKSGRMGTSGARARKKAWDAYYADPNICGFCAQVIQVRPGEKIKQTRNRKYCSTRCYGKAQSDAHAKLPKVLNEAEAQKYEKRLEEWNKNPALCLHCEHPIPLRPRTKICRMRLVTFCSPACRSQNTSRGKFHKLLAVGTCDFCKADVEPSRKFCSVSCKRAMKRAMGRVSRSNTAPYRREKNQEIKRSAVEYKGGSCEGCGYDKCLRALHFHHRVPSKKEFAISSSTDSTADWETIRRELDKCALLCANCHAEVHAGLRILASPELDAFGLPVAA